MSSLEQTAATDFCLTLPASVLEQPFGPALSVMKVVGKVFAIITRDAAPAVITLKCEPPRVLDLVAEHEAIIPGYHMNKRHWITVTLGSGHGSPSLPAELVQELIVDSYDLVVDGLPRRLRPVGWTVERHRDAPLLPPVPPSHP